ncbi:MAG: hypothetical protein R3C28_10655 [Pirellulaceae bacterium]
MEESNAQNVTRQLTQNTLLADTQVATEDNSHPTETPPTETPTSPASPAQMTVAKTDATLDSPSPQANPVNETAIAAVPTNATPERRVQADSPQDISKPTQQLTRDATQPATPNLESVVQDTSVRPKSSDIDSSPDDAVASAVTRAKQGIAGAGVEPNFDRETPAQASLVTTGSASAKRASSTQTQEGPALAPSDAPKIKRAVAEASVPSASLYAQEVDAAVTSGADQPADIDLAASSSVSKAGANAMPAPVSAQQGTAEVDFGPTRIAASVGLQKAAGGGQPEPNLRPSQSLGMARDVAGAGSFAASTNARNVSPQRPSGSDTPTNDQPSPVALQVANVNTNGGPAQLLAHAAGQANTSEADLAPSAAAPSTALPSRATQSSASELNDIVARSGGGSNQPLRKSQGTRIFVPSSAETVTLSGENASSGVPDAAPVAANNQAHRRTPTGIVGPIENEQTGALSADVQLDGANAGPSEMLPGRVSSAELDDPVGPMPISPAGQGLQVARHVERQLPTGALGPTKVEFAPMGTRSETPPDTFLEDPALAVSTGPMSRPADGGLVVQTEATAGLGGFLAETGPSVALRRRTGLAESEFIAKLPERFLRRELGSPIPLPNPKPVPTDAYQTRINRRGEANAGGRGRPSAKTEQAIEMGLVFLSRTQSPDGSWSLNVGGDGKPYSPNETPIIRSDTAATGLALLSFLGAGYHHQDDKYKDVVKKGLEFLLANQDDDGNLFIPQDENSAASAGLYSHGIAAIALSEAYGMTQDDWLREPAQRSLNYISAAQHESRGGWRYTPGISADTSVSGWMMMALRSGELASLDVSVETLELIEKWLDSAKASKAEPHLFRYNPYAPNNASQGHGRIASKTMTAVGLLMRLYTGWSRDKAEMMAGADYLLENLPSVEMEDNASQRDTYYWYYATQVMFHMRGEYWEKWNQALHPLLVDTQIIEGPLAGSWDPFYPVADRWAPHGGRLYVTTLNLLSLEVYYRHLPIYEDTAQ